MKVYLKKDITIDNKKFFKNQTGWLKAVTWSDKKTDNISYMVLFEKENDPVLVSQTYVMFLS